MKLLDRFMLVLYALLMVFFLAIIGLTAWGVFAPGDIAAVIQFIQESLWLCLLLTLACVLLIVFSVVIMFLNTHKEAPSSALIKVTEEGSLRISIATLNQLSAKYAKGVAGIRDVRTHVLLAEEGIVVQVKAALLPDAVAAETCQAVQQAMKVNLETVAGLQVKGINVLVDNNLSPVK